jgi:hypothetical protein
MPALPRLAEKLSPRVGRGDDLGIALVWDNSREPPPARWGAEGPGTGAAGLQIIARRGRCAVTVLCLFVLAAVIGGVLCITAIETYEVDPQFYLRAQRTPAGMDEVRPDGSAPVIADGLELVIRPVAAEFWAFEQLAFEVNLKNVSAQTFRLADLDSSWVRPSVEVVNATTQTRWQIDLAVPAFFPPSAQGKLLQPDEGVTWYVVVDRRIPLGTHVPPTPVREGNELKYYPSRVVLRRAVPPCGVGPVEACLRLEFTAEVGCAAAATPAWSGRITSQPVGFSLWRNRDERVGEPAAAASLS